MDAAANTQKKTAREQKMERREIRQMRKNESKRWI